ncbi:MAG: tetratricopeptide repeat protein [Enhygromyxa sp.]
MRSSLPIVVGVLALACDPGRRGPIEPEPEPEPKQAAGSACVGAKGPSLAWSPGARDELAAALEQLPGEWPSQLLAWLDARLPEHAQGWTEAHRQACEGGDAVVLRCLDRRAWELDALLALIVEEPGRASALWSRLGRSTADPRACESATGDAPPELDRARGRELASLAALIELHELSQVKPLLVELGADPVLAGAPSYALELELARVDVELASDRVEQAEQALARAEALAEKLDAGARRAVADKRASLALARGDVEAGERAREQAVALAREQADPWLLVTQLREQGRARLERGDAERAVAPLVEAIGLLGRVGGADSPETAEVQTILAQAQLGLGQVEAAHDTLTQARDAFVISLGPDHPQTLATVEAVGHLLVAAGRLGDAQFAFLDLLEIYTELYGVKHWRTARIKLELADSLMAMDQHDSARTLYTEALTPLAQELGPVHPDVVRTSIHLGIAELALGNLDAAEPHCSRGRDLAKGLASDTSLAQEAERCLTQITASRAGAKNENKRRP